MIETGILLKGQVLNDLYEVLLFIKKGAYAETYRVKSILDKKIYFLKLINNTKLHHTSFDSQNNVLEIEILKNIHHQNVVKYRESGNIILESKKYTYLVLDFISGETLSEAKVRSYFTSFYDIKKNVIDILDSAIYLHSLENPILHNDLTPNNIMIDLGSNETNAKIIDFGFARFFQSSSDSFTIKGLNLNFVASECLNNIFSPQSDLYSIGAILYYLIYGSPPWSIDLSKQTKINEVFSNRSQKLSFPNLDKPFFDFDLKIIEVLKKALSHDTDMRFQNAYEFKEALQNLSEFKLEEFENIPIKKVKSERKKGLGFDAIAGMNALKQQLQTDVIDALNNPEEYSKYGVSIPNGILLYGPPGCGKTFFAKHFAEEVGFNFMSIAPSNLKSRYVNATQENIAKMFEDAIENAPTIIFIDEINELLPNRESDSHEMSKSAVNEMLAQMDRTGEKGVFIIGATNFPHMIDPAILRAGRLDKKFYISPPDYDARLELFKKNLENRPLDFGIRYDELATLTENYVSADINLIVDDASRLALVKKQRISMTILQEIIKATPPSVPLEVLNKYTKIDNNPDQTPINKPRIGFKP